MSPWAEIDAAVPAGWHASDPSQDEVDRRVDAAVDAALAAPPAELAGHDVDPEAPQQARLLEVYAQRAAARAVRAGDPQLLRRAAAALVLAGPAADYRELVMRIAVVADAGRRVQLPLTEVADGLAEHWGEARVQRFRQFAGRAPDQQSLGVMGWRADEADGRLTYVDTAVEAFDVDEFAALLTKSGAPQSVIDELRGSG